MEELRAFMEELVMRTSLREAGRLIGRGHEMVRKFIDGSIKRPQDRTRRAMALLYLERRKELHLMESSAPPTSGPLKTILPRGLDAATTEVKAVFEAIHGGGRLVSTATALENWLIRRLREEYAKPDPKFPTARKRRGS
ncbi:MAG TPA: hypothetical protein VFQ45_16745 [Longimicrobium sp.]|nr:hypothetical protein [Longimicrobium sp.]